MSRLTKRIWQWCRFVARDLLARRAGLEVVLGGFSIAAGAAGLLIVLVFTQGVYSFVDACFARAKPVIGSVRVGLKGGGRLSRAQALDLARLTSEDFDVESLSWVSRLHCFQFRRNASEEFAGAPRVWSLPAGARSILDPSNGVRYLDGGPLAIPQGNRPSFGILVNTRFLQNFLDFDEKEVISLLRGDLGKLPRSIWIHFTPVQTLDEPFEPGTIEMPIQGVFNLRDEVFPDMVVSPEVAGAVFFNREVWSPSFTLQFGRGDGSGPIVPEKRVDGVRLDRQGSGWVSLPPVDQLRDLEAVAGRDKSPYELAVLLLRDYRRPGIRSGLKQHLEEPREILQVDLKGRPKLRDGLDQNEPGEVVTLLTQEAKEPLSDNIAFERSGSGWTLRDRDRSARYRLSRQGETLRVLRETPWSVQIPSDTVSEALNQVTLVVGFYSWAMKLTILGLSTLTSLLLGIGYIHRKRKDIGVLKASGVGPLELGAIYGSQVLLVCAAGALVGVGLASGLAGQLEPLANSIVRGFHLDFAGSESVMRVARLEVGQALLWVLGGALVGILLPCWKAMTINPIEDLRAGL